MNKADKNDTIDTGFVLCEQDFRRLTDTAREQLSKKGDAKDIISAFSVKFKNGTIYETDDIEDVLNLENGGGGLIKIVEVTIQLVNKSHKIRFKYSDPNYTDNDAKPIVYSVYGEDRDWVFVSNSQIEERLKTTSRSKLLHIKVELNTFLTLFMIGFIAASFYAISNIFNGREGSEYAYYWQYDKAWEDFIESRVDPIGELKEFATKNPDAKPIEVFIKYKELTNREREMENKAREARHVEAEKWAREKNQQNSASNKKFSLVEMLFVMFGSGFVLPTVFLIYITIIKNVYPLYVFAWGDEKTNFERKESTRKFILGTLLAGLAVSFIAGILANMI